MLHLFYSCLHSLLSLYKKSNTFLLVQANGGALRASKRQLGTNAKQTEAEWLAPSTLSNPMDNHALGHRHSTPQKGQAAAQLPALVETDPFATNDIIRCKAC